jgi:hypothetical protein
MATTPATDWKEQIEPDEGPRFERYAQSLLALQRRNAAGKEPLRTLHAKGLGLQAELHVLPDLPEYARVGLFSRAASYRCYVRFSNGASKVQSDKTPDVRGVAIKVVGVEGKKVIPGLENAKTQDFLLIRTPTVPFRSASEFVPFVTAMTSPALGLPKMLFQLGPARLFSILGKAVPGLNAPMAPLHATRYFSTLPIQFGPYAVHYALTPHEAADGAPRAAPGPEYLAEELGAKLRTGPVTYDFQVQFYVDPVKTPIEDASVEWTAANAPFVTLARLVLLQQDITSNHGQAVASFVEGLSFDPWHALTELKPLGNMMRARNVAYRVSTQERKAAPEPDGTESIG